MSDSAWTTELSADVAGFLLEFERRGAAPEGDDGAQFHDSFVVADPNQANVISRELFVQSLPYRRAMFAKAGVGGSHLVRASQLDLDERYSLVRTEWDAVRADADPLRLESTFLLMRHDGGATVLAYVNHRDITRILADLAAGGAD